MKMILRSPILNIETYMFECRVQQVSKYKSVKIFKFRVKRVNSDTSYISLIFRSQVLKIEYFWLPILVSSLVVIESNKQ